MMSRKFLLAVENAVYGGLSSSAGSASFGGAALGPLHGFSGLAHVGFGSSAPIISGNVAFLSR